MRSSITGKLSVALSAGVFAAMVVGPSWADNLVSMTEVQSNYTGAAPMGVSTSSISYLKIHNVPYCYAGTLGAVLQDGSSNRYVLSNNHVLAKENGNLNYPGTDNYSIIQAGLMDAGNCSPTPPAATIARLSRYVAVGFSTRKSITTNYVDAAIAGVTGNVSSAIVGLGDLGGTQASSAIMFGEKVQKVGRTTAHTMGVVATIENSLKVSYESGTAYFDNQIGITEACGGSFSDSGDSGSMVELVPETNSPPLAVGLLFAGDSTYTWANEIDKVLSELNGSVNIFDTGNSSISGLNLVTGNNYSGPTTFDYDNYVSANCPSGGGGGGSGGGGGGGGGGKSGGKGPHLAKNPAGLDRAIDVKKNHSQEIFAMPNVVGHGIGEDENGNAVINIYISQDRGGRYYPPNIEGVKVRVIKTGPIRAY